MTYKEIQAHFATIFTGKLLLKKIYTSSIAVPTVTPCAYITNLKYDPSGSSRTMKNADYEFEVMLVYPVASGGNSDVFGEYSSTDEGPEIEMIGKFNELFEALTISYEVGKIITYDQLLDGKPVFIGKAPFTVQGEL